MTQPHRKGVLLDPLTIAQIKEAYAEGVKVATLAKRLGVSTSTVYAYTGGIKRVPCPQCKTPMAKKSKLCRRCAEKSMARAGWAQQEQRPGSGAEGGDTRTLPWQCAKSPTGAHYWVLDIGCVGECQHCREVRRFVTWFETTPKLDGR